MCFRCIFLGLDLIYLVLFCNSIFYFWEWYEILYICNEYDENILEWIK